GPELLRHSLVDDDNGWFVGRICLCKETSRDQANAHRREVLLTDDLGEHFGVLTLRRFGLVLSDQRTAAVESAYRLRARHRDVDHSGKASDARFERLVKRDALRRRGVIGTAEPEAGRQEPVDTPSRILL